MAALQWRDPAMSQPWELPLRDAAALLRSRQISAMELLRSCLARLDEVEERLNALDAPRGPAVRARGKGTLHPGSTPLIAAANLAGLPAVFFPCGLSPQGLPVGLQLVGPHGSDYRLLAAVAAFQRETAYTRLTPGRRPPV